MNSLMIQFFNKVNSQLRDKLDYQMDNGISWNQIVDSYRNMRGPMHDVSYSITDQIEDQINR